MNKAAGPNVQWHITIIFDWKMVAVVSISVLIRLLVK